MYIWAKDRSILYRIFICTASFIVLALFLLLFNTNKAGAAYTSLASETFPNPASSTPTHLYMTVGSGEFNLQTSAAAITVGSVGSYIVTIDEATFCNLNSYYSNYSLDLPQSSSFSSPYFSTVFRVLDRNLNQQSPTLNTGFSRNCTSRTMTLSFNVDANDYDARIGKYMVLFVGSVGSINPAYGRTVPGAAENSFRIILGGSKIYPIVEPFLGNNVFTNLSNRNRLDSTHVDYTLDLSIACSASPTNLSLSLYDIDNGDLQATSAYQTMTFSISRALKSYGIFQPLVPRTNIVGAGTGNHETYYLPNTTMTSPYIYRYSLTGLARRNAISYNAILNNVGAVFAEDNCENPSGTSCTISNVVRFSDNNANIRPNDQIKFNVTITGGSGYTLGVNGSGWGNEYNAVDIQNYLVGGTAYIRGPNINSNNFTTTVSSVTYTPVSGPAAAININAPSTVQNNVAFSWGLVINGFGWLPVTCSGSFNVTNPDVCSNISGDQAVLPPGYNQSGSSCVFPDPTCNLVIVDLLYDQSFVMRANIRNNSSAVMDVKSLSYGTQVSGNANNTNDIAGNSSGQFDSESERIPQAGTFNITWAISYGTLYGDQTRNLACTRLNVAPPQLECEINTIPVSINNEFNISVVLRNNTSTNIPVSGPASYEIYNSAGTRIFTGSGYPYNTSTNSYYSPAYPQNVSPGNSLTIRSQAPPILTVPSAGLYDVRWSVTTTGGSPAIMAIGDCANATDGDDAIDAMTRPYVRFYGNDVVAGGTYGETCSVTGDPDALGNGSFTGIQPHASYKGSAAELAVFATGQISGVLPGSQDITRPLGSTLGFANTSSGTGSLAFGGGFSDPMCVDDFWASRPENTEMTQINVNNTYVYTAGATPQTAVLLDLSSLPASGNYYYEGPEVHIYASAPLTRRITLYTAGTTYIGADDTIGSIPTAISYANTAGWANKESIPLFKLVTLGNIIIDNDIRSLDGFFIASEDSAQPPDTTGEIHTCGLINSFLDVTRPAFDTALIASDCGNQLVVNGAFIAKRTKLLRTLGDVSSAPVPPEAASSATIAEVFRFSPELYLALLSEGTQNMSGSFDSIVSLPPAL